MSDPRKLFGGTVVIVKLEIQDKQCRKTVGKLWAGNYPRNLVWDLHGEILQKNKMEYWLGYPTKLREYQCNFFEVRPVDYQQKRTHFSLEIGYGSKPEKRAEILYSGGNCHSATIVWTEIVCTCVSSIYTDGFYVTFSRSAYYKHKYLSYLEKPIYPPPRVN